jgi:hypothetical protein
VGYWKKCSGTVLRLGDEYMYIEVGCDTVSPGLITVSVPMEMPELLVMILVYQVI